MWLFLIQQGTPPPPKKKKSHKVTDALLTNYATSREYNTQKKWQHDKITVWYLHMCPVEVLFRVLKPL